jgi:hypothetical protein
MPQITRTPVQSSSIKSHGYDPNTQTLAVEFTSGHVYHLSGVPPEDAQAFASAPSLGSHWHANLRGKYESTRIEEETHGEEE